MRMSVTLAQLEDCMDEKQYAYYSLVCSRLTKDPAEKIGMVSESTARTAK